MIPGAGRVPVEDIKLVDDAGRAAYTPQDDLALDELSKIMTLMIKVLLQQLLHGDLLAWRAYLVDHGLTRHFTFEVTS